MTQAHARSIMLIALSSLCSRPCSNALHLPSTTVKESFARQQLGDPLRNLFSRFFCLFFFFWEGGVDGKGWEVEARLVTITCLICLLG